MHNRDTLSLSSPDRYKEHGLRPRILHPRPQAADGRGPPGARLLPRGRLQQRRHDVGRRLRRPAGQVDRAGPPGARHVWVGGHAPPMDQISTKTTNPKCRLYWCLIEFIDKRYNQSGISDPSCELAPLFPPPPPPCVNKYRGLHSYRSRFTKSGSGSRNFSE